MSVRISASGFEGPFDLLLQLVARDKVDIGTISISTIASQYLAEVDRMHELDLDVASDFVLIAATLLDLKAASLIPGQDEVTVELEDGLESMTASELREVLVGRLVAYHTYSGAASALGARLGSQELMHPRTAGPDPEFLDLMPDYLDGLTLDALASICAELFERREVELLESEHIAAPRVPLETRVEQVGRQILQRRHVMFDELLGDDPGIQNRVVSFLAILELGKRHVVSLTQDVIFGPIAVDWVGEDEVPVFDEEEEGDDE